ncbi:MAG: hypothetical protein V8S95_05430 [Odoribacter sp.]
MLQIGQELIKERMIIGCTLNKKERCVVATDIYNELDWNRVEVI